MWQRATKGASGGSSVKSDTITLTANQTTTISTGLSNVNKFIIYRAAYSSEYIYTSSEYTRDANSSLYAIGGYNGATGFGGKGSVGSAIDSVKSITINSISGGDVSITAFSNSAWDGDYTWYAE